MAVSIGTVASSVIRSKPDDNFEVLISEAEKTLSSRVGEFSYLIYASIALLIATIICGLLNHFGVNPIGWTVTGLKLECPPGWLN